MTSNRPDLDEVLGSAFERVEHALRLADEAWSASDEEDKEGNPIDPIHRYADSIVKETLPVAVMALFLVAARSLGVRRHDQQ